MTGIYSEFWMFELKNFFNWKWINSGLIYSCPRPKLKSLQLVPQWPNPKNGPNHMFLCQYPCFKEWGKWFCDIQPGLMYNITWLLGLQKKIVERLGPTSNCPNWCVISYLPFSDVLQCMLLYMFSPMGYTFCQQNNKGCFLQGLTWEERYISSLCLHLRMYYPFCHKSY